MRGRGCGDDAPGCGGEWGRGDGTTLAGRLWAMVTAGLGVVGWGSSMRRASGRADLLWMFRR